MDLAPRPEPLVSLRGISKHFGAGETRIDALRRGDLDAAAEHSESAACHARRASGCACTSRDPNDCERGG